MLDKNLTWYIWDPHTESWELLQEAEKPEEEKDEDDILH